MTLSFNAARHLYRLDGKPVPGVTTLIGKGLPKPALVRWAANEAAAYAADNLDTLAQLDRDGRYAAIKQAPWSQRDKAGVRGTDVHALAEDLIHGRPVEVPEHLQGHVDGYVRWLDATGAEPIITERPCASRHWWYAGTFDAVIVLDGVPWLVDWKTAKGVYGDNALQVAAYAGAEFFTATDGGLEEPMPEVERLGVVHIRADGTDLYPITDREAAWKDWLHVAWVGRAEDRIKSYIGEAITPAAAPEGAVA